MFFLSKPSENVVQHFLAAQEFSRFWYSNVGQSRGGAGPAGRTNWPPPSSIGPWNRGVWARENCPPPVEDVRYALGALVLLRCADPSGAQMSQFWFRISGFGRSTRQDCLRPGGFRMRKIRIRIRHVTRTRRAGRRKVQGWISHSWRNRLVRLVRILSPRHSRSFCIPLGKIFAEAIPCRFTMRHARYRQNPL